MNIDVPELGGKLRSLGGEQSNRLTIVAEQRRLVASLEVDIFEESIPPAGLPSCIRETQQFSLGARRRYSILLGGLPIDRPIEQADDVSLGTLPISAVYLRMMRR